jgi:phage terminase large subunit-like protein
VVAGDIVAGPHVRNACARHLLDLEEGHKRGLRWDLEAANRAIGFFRDVLTVEVETDDEFGESVSQAVPFVLQPAQCFIVGSLFGWKNKQGRRRFRRAYVEQGKGNGKSPLAAGIGHYMLMSTGKLRPEVYTAATDRDQAAIPFRDAVEMWRRSPALDRRLIPSGINPVWQLTDPKTSGFFKPISSEKKGKSGIRPYCALVDEIHEHPDNSVIEMLRAGTKGNREALIFEITNSGFDRTSVCWAEHEYSVKVCKGEVENDAWFAYVCALDEGDDPFEDEACWVKANPLLGVSIHPEFVREQVEEAKGMPSKESLVRRLHFCQWTESAKGWITQETWKGIESDGVAPPDEWAGREVFGGLDLSFTSDLSAVAWVSPADDGTWDAAVDFFKPEQGLKEAAKRDNVPYPLWVDQGHLRLTKGKIIKLPEIASRLVEVAGAAAVIGIAYDRYRFRELEEDLADDGIVLPMVEHPQGFRRPPEPTDDEKKEAEKRGEKVPQLWMPASLLELENAVKEHRVRVRPNPVLRWNVASAVTRENPNGDRIFDKRKSRARIDGVVALAMATGLAASRRVNQRKPKRSLYEEGVI